MKSRTLFLSAAAVLLLLGGLATQIHGDLSPGELEKRYAGGASRFIKLGIHPRVHYRDEGPRDAPVIVLLHGTGASLHTFDELTLLLKPRYRVLRFDLTGFGLTGPCSGCDYTPREDAKLLRQFMGALGVDRAAIGGNSLGGRIAWEFGLRYPSATRALVLMNPVAYPWSEKPASISMARVPVLGNIQRWFTPRFLVSQSLRDAYYNGGLVSEAMVERYFSLLLRAGNRKAFVKRVNIELDADSARIPGLKMPVLVLWGEADALLPVKQLSLWRRDLPRAKFKVYTETGHFPQEEKSRAVAGDMLKFLER